jgi:hypothetical protein
LGRTRLAFGPEGPEAFAAQHAIPVVAFRKGERKDDVAAPYLSAFKAEEGVLFIRKAQEKAPVFRTERRRNLKTGATCPWLVRFVGLTGSAQKIASVAAA